MNEDDFIGLAAPHDVNEGLVDLEYLEFDLADIRCSDLPDTNIRQLCEDGESNDAESLPEETAELIIACLRSILNERSHENCEYIAPCLNYNYLLITGF